MARKSTYFYYILIILCILSLIESIPYIFTIIFPSVCYGCTPVGKLHQHLNNCCGFAYINMFAYLVLMLYFMYRATNIKNMIIKIGAIVFIALCIYIPVLPIINIITMVLSVINNNPPIIHDYYNLFPHSKLLELNVKTIIEEYTNYTHVFNPECINKTNPGFKIENRDNNNDNCWRSIYLKKGGKIQEDMLQYFGKTINLLKDKQIHNAIFSILDPDVEIPPHVGYYKGYLRYHLGIDIPNNNIADTSKKAYIVCGGEKYIWKQGDGILFDDMYLHYVKNPSNKRRAVLYLDVIRISDSQIINSINNIGITIIENSLLYSLFIKNQHKQNNLE